MHYTTLYELYHFSTVLCRGKRLLLTSRCCRWELFSLMTSAVTSSRVRWSSLWSVPSLMAGARSRSPPQEWSYTSRRWTGKKGSVLRISYGSHLTCAWENIAMVFPKSTLVVTVCMHSDAFKINSETRVFSACYRRHVTISSTRGTREPESGQWLWKMMYINVYGHIG